MQQYKAKENSLLLLNPVTNGQFLTFLYYIKRLKIFAEVAYNNPFTINYISQSVSQSVGVLPKKWYSTIGSTPKRYYFCTLGVILTFYKILIYYSH